MSARKLNLQRFAEQHIAAGEQHWRAGNRLGAEQMYRRALELQPDSALAVAKLALLFEMTHQLERARELLEAALLKHPTEARLHLIAALVDRRTGQVDRAVERLESLCDSEMSWRCAVKRHFQLGDLYDSKGAFASAWSHYERGNRLRVASEPELDSLKRQYSESIAFHAGLLNEPLSEAPLDEDPNHPSPCFLVGFPRSGTTLLEQVLDSHADVRSLSERPALECVVDKARACLDGSSARRLSGSQVAALRELYYSEARRYVQLDRGHLLIDKLPLSIVRVPFILQLFPRARFILAIRHPADVCLSGFFQNFQLNPAMAHFCALPDITALYSTVMSQWRRYMDVLRPSFHMVRYEDLVSNFELEARRVIDSLGLAWDASIAGFDARVKGGGSVNTPSYAQVAKPIYADSVARWRRYERFVGGAFEALQPDVERFGYSASV